MAEKDRIDFSIFLSNYLNDTREGFQEINSALLELEKDHGRKELLDEIFRVVHTLKSSSVMLEFSDIAELAHISEDLLDRMRKDKAQVTQETINVLFEVVDMLEAMVKRRAEGKSEPTEVWKSRFEELKNKIRSLADLKSEMETPEIPNPNSAAGRPTVGKIQTVRVHVELLDSIFNLAGELIITKNRIDNIISNTANKELKAVLAAMDRMISALQEYASAARLVPIDEIFQKYPRMVRDLAKEKNKEIDLVIEGRGIELDKAILDGISEPLIHLIRNAVDHGIEPAEVRKNSNKAEQGAIKLSAKRAENHILIEVEDDGNIVEANPQACKMYGYPYEELIKLSGKDIVHPDYYHLFEQFKRDVQMTGEFHTESVDVHKDGTTFDIEIRGAGFDYRGKPHLLAVIRDITERKQAQEALKRAHDELEIRIRERTKELTDTKLQAEAATRAKSDLLANMSHELRTPLNAIIGFSDMMFKGMTGKLTEQQLEYLGDIRESGLLLLSLINDILDLSKVEAGKTDLELSEFNVKDLIERGIILFKEKAMKHILALPFVRELLNYTMAGYGLRVR
jgi:PAS domain S-box-containing protein